MTSNARLAEPIGGVTKVHPAAVQQFEDKLPLPARGSKEIQARYLSRAMKVLGALSNPAAQVGVLALLFRVAKWNIKLDKHHDTEGRYWEDIVDVIQVLGHKYPYTLRNICNTGLA